MHKEISCADRYFDEVIVYSSPFASSLQIVTLLGFFPSTAMQVFILSFESENDAFS